MLHRYSVISVRLTAVKQIIGYFKNDDPGIKAEDLHILKKGKVSKSWFAKYAKVHPPLQRVCNTQVKHKSIRRMYHKAVKVYVDKNPTVVEEDSGTDHDEKRYVDRKASEVREKLMGWYGIIRHSVDTKIMVRCTKKVLLVKAKTCIRSFRLHICGIISSQMQLTFIFLGESVAP